MKIAIDNRNKDIIYVDKVNLHNATNNDIIKLVNTNVNDKDIDNVNSYINIIAGYYNLDKYERSILLYIILENNNVTYRDITRLISKHHKVNAITIVRAIDRLKAKYLINIKDYNIVNVSNTIYKSVEEINKAKFIIIELNPKDNEVSI